MKKLAMLLLLAASGAWAQAVGSGGVPGTTAAVVTCGTNNIPCTNTANTYTVGPQTVSAAGAASTPGLSVTGAPFAGTASNSLGQISLNWNTGAQPSTLSTSGTGLTIFAQSGFGGNLISFYTGTAAEFNVSAAGAVFANQNISAGGTMSASGGLFGGLFQSQTTTPSTSSTCFSPGAGVWQGTYWTGSASATNSIKATPSCVAGANGAETLTFGNTGSTGQFSVAINGQLNVSQLIQPTTLYSAAGTALPTCSTGLKGAAATVVDATSPTYLGTYTSGGAVTARVLCNGTAWVTD